MSDYINNLQNIDEALNVSGPYSTSVDIGMETIAETKLEGINANLTSGSDFSEKEFSSPEDSSVEYMAPKRVTIKRYQLKK